MLGTIIGRVPDAATATIHPPVDAAAPAAWRIPAWAMLVAPLLAATLVLVATRQDPLLSPDSITYLSVADHIRSGQGLTDFTTKPMAVFGPVYPLLLSPGGRSLMWATFVGVASIAIASALMATMLHRRVRPVVALAGALAFGASQGFVQMVGRGANRPMPRSHWQPGRGRRHLTTRTVALGGCSPASGSSRYAGVGLIAMGAVMHVASAWRPVGGPTWPSSSAPCGGAISLSSIWPFATSSRPGSLWAHDSLASDRAMTRTIDSALSGTGHIVVGDGWSESALIRIGAIVIVAVAILLALALYTRAAVVLDLGMATFAFTSFVVPIVARRATANDIELRVMSPILIPVIYAACVTFDRFCTRRVLAVAGTALLGWWMYQGVAFAARFPDFAPAGAGYKPQFSPQLYDAIDALPADARILTNSPQRVWWFTDRSRPSWFHAASTVTVTIRSMG
jgi:hypothetical protein